MKTFDFNRFKKVVVRDFHSTYNLFGMSMLIIMLVPAIVWLLQMAVGLKDIEPFARMQLIHFLSALTAAISSMKIYKSCNLSGTGNYFAMLPASLGEKMWSMMLYCFIVTPFVVFFGAYAVDTILTCLPVGPFDRFLWQHDDWWDMFSSKNPVMTGFRGFLLFVSGLMSTASLFMFTNTIFKKSKFVKTILWLLLISVALVIIIAPFLNRMDWDFDWMLRIQNWFLDKGERFFVNLLFCTQLVINLLFAAIMSFLTYRRLKKMQY